MSPERYDMQESEEKFPVQQKDRVYVYIVALNHIYVQIINDANGHTLVSASTLDPEIRVCCRQDKKGSCQNGRRTGSKKGFGKGN